MHRLIYTSRARPGIKRAEVEKLEEDADRRNALFDLSGILICDGLTFCQVLEGDAAVIKRLMRNIQRDSRNSEILVMSNLPIRERKFPEWSMKLVTQIDFAGLLTYTREWSATPALADLSSAFRGWRASDAARSAWPAIYAPDSLA